ncbi:SOS response-associated peptidase [Acetobacterium paludosum]|uniref:Abasic site processing protein n=1 Tax=Acetobacterium paludosum TaxID=52693 RepID=A0A923HYH2_9FIRM|nr:SOS response-associated peptidase family protein [Acetobacterium paludosum]MBC3888341.1 SOS response-associated peptidase [Acetobacterium paludosum]
MCGRYILFSDKEERAIKAIVEEVNKKYHTVIKKGDIYPTDLAPVYALRPDQRGMDLELKRWGYNRQFGKKKTLLINARSETVLEKAAFRDDFLNRRCLIPAVAFYEWNEEKEKFRFSGTDELIYLGGFYHGQTEGSDAFLIMTKPSVETVAQIHNRMPVLIPADLAMDFLYSTETALKIIAENRVTLKRKLIEGEKQGSFIGLTED